MRGLQRDGRQPSGRGTRGLPSDPGRRHQRGGQRTGVPPVALAGHPRRDDHSAGRRSARGKVESICQRYRPRLRQRPVSDGLGRNLPKYRSGPLHGDRQLRDLRQRDGHVRCDGLRQTDGRYSDAAAARRAEHRMGFRGTPDRRRARRGTRRARGNLRARPGSGSLRDLVRPYRGGHRSSTAVRGDGNGRWCSGGRARTHHATARRPLSRVAAARATRRELPHRDHRRALLRHGHLFEQPQR